MLRKSAVGRLFDQRFGPTEVFDFTKGVAGQIKGTTLTCSGGVNGTVIDPNGNIVAASAPRITHAPLGVTNSLLQSEDLSDIAYWPGSTPTRTKSTTEFFGGSPFWTLTKTVNAVEALYQQLSVNVVSGYGIALTLVFLGGTAPFTDFGLYDVTNNSWGLAGGSTCSIVSGPGSVSQVTGGLWRVSSLSATVPTVVTMQRTYAAAASAIQFLVYPGGSTASTAGYTVKVAQPMLELGVAVRSGRYVPTGAVPVTVRDCLGLLVEPPRTNSIWPSIVPGGTATAQWVNNGAGTAWTSNAGTAPDGTNTATLSNIAGGPVTKYQVISVTAGVKRCMGKFVKRGTATAEQLLADSTGVVPTASVNFTFSTKSFGTISGPITSTGYIEFVNGWFYIWAVYTPSATANATIHARPIGGDNYYWHFQDEVGEYPTSLIPTTVGAVTRTAEIIRIEAPSWLPSGVGTVAVEASYTGGAALLTNNRVALSLESSSEYRAIIYNRAAQPNSVYVQKSAVQLFSSVFADTTANHVRAVFSFNGANMLHSNTGAAANSTSVADPTALQDLQRISIGSVYSTGTGHLGGVVRRIAFHNRFLSAGEAASYSVM